MKKNILYSLLLAGAAFSFTACTDDGIDSVSVITADIKEETPLDKWLTVNFLNPYNIEIKYRYEYNETDKSYYTVPAQYDQAIEMAHIVKYSCVEAYDEVAGIEFTRRYFPKMFFLIGEWQYRNNGTFELGTAEGGKKINLMGVNYIDTYKTSIESLNTFYLKTVHHEFTHILNQTTDYSATYQLVTSTGYVADSWNTSPHDSAYLERGFISSYAQFSHSEDFAEMLSTYVTSTATQWEAWMEEAAGTKSDPKPGRDYLETKLKIVRDYMKNTFNIDIDELRESILRREQAIIDGKINLYDVSVN